MFRAKILKSSFFPNEVFIFLLKTSLYTEWASFHNEHNHRECTAFDFVLRENIPKIKNVTFSYSATKASFCRESGHPYQSENCTTMHLLWSKKSTWQSTSCSSSVSKFFVCEIILENNTIYGIYAYCEDNIFSFYTVHRTKSPT